MFQHIFSDFKSRLSFTFSINTIYLFWITICRICNSNVTSQDLQEKYEHHLKISTLDIVNNPIEIKQTRKNKIANCDSRKQQYIHCYIFLGKQQKKIFSVYINIAYLIWKLVCIICNLKYFFPKLTKNILTWFKKIASQHSN